LIRSEPTLENGELGAAEVLAGFLESYGLACEVDKWDNRRANLVTHLKSAGERPGLMFVCHLDVVPTGDAKWRFEPFDGVESDGKIHGRGAADMKGGTVAIASAIAEVVAEKIPLKGDLVFAATAGEETDSCGVKRFVKANLSTMPSLAGIIIPEPTGFEIVTAHRGLLWVEISTKGKTAHGSMPELGINAISSMNRLLNVLADFTLPCEKHPLLGGCTMSINQIQGGQAINVVPDHCSIKIDIRTVPGQDHDAILGSFQQLLEEMKNKDSEFSVDIKTARSVEPMQTDNDSDFVRSICEITGIEKNKAVGYATDAPFVTAFNSPVLVFGPGDSALCHKPDEYIDLCDIETAKRFYKDIILKMLT